MRFAAEVLDLETKGLPSQHPLLQGALARFEDGTIYFRNDVEDWLAAYYQVHEIGHVVLRHGGRQCTEAAINPEASETKIPFGVHRVEGYGDKAEALVAVLELACHNCGYTKTQHGIASYCDEFFNHSDEKLTALKAVLEKEKHND